MGTIFNPNANPCNCTVVNQVSHCPSTYNKKDDCCLTLCNLVTDKTVYPCNDSGQINLTSYIKIPSCCKEQDIVLSIPYHDSNVTNLSFVYTLDKKFLLSFTSNYTDGGNYKSSKIVYQVKCGILKVQAEVIVLFKQHNTEENCFYEYNPCTGDCIEPKPEVIANSLENSLKLG